MVLCGLFWFLRRQPDVRSQFSVVRLDLLLNSAVVIIIANLLINLRTQLSARRSRS